MPLCAAATLNEIYLNFARNLYAKGLKEISHRSLYTVVISIKRQLLSEEGIINIATGTM
jgi:hypothetical protein